MIQLLIFDILKIQLLFIFYTFSWFLCTKKVCFVILKFSSIKFHYLPPKKKKKLKIHEHILTKIANQKLPFKLWKLIYHKPKHYTSSLKNQTFIILYKRFSEYCPKKGNLIQVQQIKNLNILLQVYQIKNLDILLHHGWSHGWTWGAMAPLIFFLNILFIYIWILILAILFYKSTRLPS